jgi:hypothetical protein
MKDDNDFIQRARAEQREVIAQASSLQQQRDGIDRKLVALEARRVSLGEAIRLYSELMGVPLDAIATPSKPLFPETPPPKLGSVANMAYEALLAHGSPMKVRDIADVLVAAGKFPDQEPRLQYATVFGVIRRDKRFRKLGQGVFGLADWEGRIENGQKAYVITDLRNGNSIELERPSELSRTAVQS